MRSTKSSPSCKWDFRLLLHNFLHPLCGVMWFFGVWIQWADWLHDATAPKAIPREDADSGRAGAAEVTATAAWDALPATERAGYLAYLADDARDVRNDKTDFGPRWIRILRAVSDALARPDAPSAFAPRREP